MEYHGIIFEVEQRDKSIFNQLNVTNKFTIKEGTSYKILVDEKDLEKTINLLQNNLPKGQYVHLHKSGEYIIIFERMVFRLKVDEKTGDATGKTTWEDVMDYSRKTTGTPKEDFFGITSCCQN